MSEGRKRIEPRMTRGGFHWQLVMLTLLTITPISQLVFRSNELWDGLHNFMVAILVLCAAFLAYLLYVRHHDGHFWDEEEARRADWDRRGRQL